jgi:hypothetical protein
VELGASRFDRSVGSDHSDLTGSIRPLFERARGLRRGEDFLDFVCPGCGLPVRVIFSFSVVGKGESVHTVTEILERATP